MNSGIDISVLNEHLCTILLLNGFLVNTLLPNNQADETLRDLKLEFFLLKLSLFLLNSLFYRAQLRHILIIELYHSCDSLHI